MRTVVAVLLVACLLSLVPATADEVITFDNLKPDTKIFTQYGDLGVIFPQTPRIVEADGYQAHSGANVLTNYSPGEEFGGPMIIKFNVPQTRVKFWCGLLSNSGGNQVEVRAWVLNENDQQLGYKTTQVGPGPGDVDSPIEFTVELAKIYGVKIQYVGGYFSVIDDLEFSTAGPQIREDTEVPQIDIKKPKPDERFIDGFRQHAGAITLEGQIHEAVKLKEVTVTCTQRENTHHGTLNFAGGPPWYSFGGPNIHGLVFEGENHITVTARDFAGNTASDSIDVYYHPLTGDAELLVLAPREFYDALIPLAQWKNGSGISCHVMTLDAIEADTRFSPQRDMPRRIKEAIAHAYRFHNTRYVMLVGDADKFPVRYHQTGRVNVGWGVVWPATELYYADLFKEDGSFDDWDADISGPIGQWWEGTRAYQRAANFDQINMDDCDLHPDVALGRVPASTVYEVSNYVYKVVEYEMNGRQPWFENAVLWNGGKDFRNDAVQLDEVSATHLSDFTCQKHYRPEAWDSWNTDTRQQYEHGEWVPAILSDLNQGAGMAVSFDHGGDWMMGVLTSGYIATLNNEGRWPVVISNGCDTGKFTYIHGYYRDIDNRIPLDTEHGWGGPEVENPEPDPIQPPSVDHECLAEALLCYRTTGAVGFLGAHQGVNDASPPYVRGFLKAWPEGTRRLGDMWVYGVDRFINHYLRSGHWFGKSPFQSHHVHKFVLFGDPSLRLGQIPIQTLSAQAQPTMTQLKARVKALPVQHRPDTHEIQCPRFSNDGNITISGKAGPRMAVHATEDGEILGATQADGKGRFSLELTGLAEGKHVVGMAAGAPKPKLIAAAARRPTGQLVRFDVQLHDPTVSNLTYPKSCPQEAFFVQGETQYDATFVELRENGKPVFGDRSRNGGRFVLRPVKPIPDGSHTMSLYLETGAGRAALVEDCVTVTIGGKARPARPLTRPTLPKVPGRTK